MPQFEIPDNISSKTYRSCYKKKRFFSKGGAETTASDIERKEGKTIDVYKCSYCGYYHIGHHTDKKERRRLKLQENITIACNQLMRGIIGDEQHGYL